MAFTKDLKNGLFYSQQLQKRKKRTDRKNTVRLKLLTASVDEDGNWSDVEELPFNNDNYSVAHPALSLDGKKLFFASDMPDNRNLTLVCGHLQGGHTEIQSTWVKVNTEGRESFPYIASNGNFTSLLTPLLALVDLMYLKQS